MRIAYHFDFNYLGEAPTGLADDVIRFTEAWRHKVERGLLASVRQRMDLCCCAIPDPAWRCARVTVVRERGGGI